MTLAHDVDAVRAFNRFHTRWAGALDEAYAGSDLALPAARIVYELAQSDAMATRDLRRALGMDSGQLSRTLADLEARRLVRRSSDITDGRRRDVALTPIGRRAFAEIDRATGDEIAGVVASLDAARRARLVAAMAEVRALLDPGGQRAVALRAPAPGDLGWIVTANAEVYAREHGWDASYEALVARIVADFAAGVGDPGQRAWIADVDGVRAGCVLCVGGDEPGLARLRLLLLEPRARGLGVGARLVDACIAFAREQGYDRLGLWTNDVLVAARRIYERAGFELVRSAPHRSFGHELVGQDWLLELRGPLENPRPTDPEAT